MFKLILFFGLATCAYSEPLLITSGTFNVFPMSVVWSFAGDGFSASGNNDPFTDHCGFCYAPFQLVKPAFQPFAAANGNLTLDGKSYILPNLSFNGGSPWASGSVFLSPQGVMPPVQGAGTYDVPFNVGGSFCVTDNPSVPPPFPFDPGNPACFSVIGAAIAHYTVLATDTPNALFQPLPTIEIVSTPEPGTLGAGMFGILLIPAAKCFRTFTTTKALGRIAVPLAGLESRRRLSMGSNSPPCR
ncbi:MAG TPA: hypothetical protein VLM42_06925 [Bryobacteraceae bacterium]|nr:hypothetical protein [Bryobacteraceae bacterium]